MMDLQKVKAELVKEMVSFIDDHEMMINEQLAAKYTGFHMINVFIVELAKLKKQAEEAGEWDALTKKEMWETIQEIRTLVNSDGTNTIISDIECFAESCHVKLCDECKQKRAPYRPFGTEPYENDRSGFITNRGEE